MGPEARLQGRIIKDLEKSGWLVVKIITCTMTGWPDIFAMKKLKNADVSTAIFIEVKDRGKKPTPLQQYVHGLIAAQGGKVDVIDSWQAYQAIKYLK